MSRKVTPAARCRQALMEAVGEASLDFSGYLSTGGPGHAADGHGDRGCRVHWAGGLRVAE